ncbi:type II toxin-antitoxin system death-on-curing family toxin [Salinarimonas sp. NSM]|uniref:type II toxin-antitoxin system death-on-curing family toxin n=1 Tax=Salinarimonas sp. NSM TaxID=3458003 RepID=UPI004037511A
MPNDREPVWLPAEVVVAIARAEVVATGESFALLRPALLESALARPRNLFHLGGVRDLVHLGVALLLAIARNHLFEQGNKRAAFVASIVFLERNLCRVDLPDDERIADDIVAVLVVRAEEADLVPRLRPFVTTWPPNA